MTTTIANPNETAFAFACQGDELIGFLHRGNPACNIGVLAIVAGGPQYRAGVGRQLVSLGRRLASEGIPVMRFDHRGIGDSEGSFRRFAAMEDDIAVAIEEFIKRAPHVQEVILWGGCDAATSVLINAHKLPNVAGVIGVNPFVSSTKTATKVARKHYMSRLLQRSFWKKVFKMEYHVADYAVAGMQKVRKKLSRNKSQPNQKSGDGQGHFVDDLLTGLRRFEGKVLFLMGGRFLLSDEFDLLIDSNDDWRAVYKQPKHQRINIEDGDQVFSGTAAQEKMFNAASEWIHSAFPERMRLKNQSADVL